MNLRDFAAHLSLSKTTVSRALNGHPEVNEKTRRRIVGEAARLGYTPNSAALRLATGKTGAFGILLEMQRNLLREPLFRDFLVGLVEELSGDDKDLIVKPTKGDAGQEYERFYGRGRVDGFVVLTPKVEDARVPLLVRRNIPFVLHGMTAGERDFSYVTIDNFGAFRRLTSLLLDLGHRRIALLNDDTSYQFAFDRLAGYRDALAERGVAADPRLHTQSLMEDGRGYRHARTLLALDEPPTALICGNVFLVEGAYRAISDSGLVPGRDMSIVAHDDVSSELHAEAFRPALTATTSSLAEAGQRVAQFLLALSGGTAPTSLQEEWKPNLVFRDSAQPPGRGGR